MTSEKWSKEVIQNVQSVLEKMKLKYFGCVVTNPWKLNIVLINLVAKNFDLLLNFKL